MSLIEYSRRHNRRNHTEELACILQRSTRRTVSAPDALRCMYDIMSYYNPSIPRSLNIDIPVRDRRVSSRNVGISRPYYQYGHVRFSHIEQPVEQEPIVNEPTLHLALQLPIRPRERRYGFMEEDDILEDLRRERFVQRITPVAAAIADILAGIYVSLTRPSNEPLTSYMLDSHHRSISGQRHSDYSLINVYGQTFRRLVYGPKIKNFILRHFKPRKLEEITELIKMQHEDMECKICYSYSESVFIKCKQCSDGEYHRSCITDWVHHRDPYHHSYDSIATCFICRNRF